MYNADTFLKFFPIKFQFSVKKPKLFCLTLQLGTSVLVIGEDGEVIQTGNEKEEKAATAIQSAFRGHIARQEFETVCILFRILCYSFVALPFHRNSVNKLKGISGEGRLKRLHLRRLKGSGERKRRDNDYPLKLLKVCG